MTDMNDIKTAKLFSIITLLVSIAVIFGWVFDIEILRTVVPNVIAMRLMTAICFVGVGLLIYALARNEEQNNCTTCNLLAIIIASFLIMLIMFISFFNILGVNFNLEEIINYNYVDHSKTFPVSVPSLSTMFCFILIAFVGILSVLCYRHTKTITKLAGAVISLISLSVLIGYLLRIPSLYFAIKGVSNAMAIHTGILFLLIGISLYLLGKRDGHKSFVEKYSIAQKLIIGFSALIAIITMMAIITSIIILENNTNLKQIKEVEAPLEVMVEQIIGYDAILTGQAHEALLHAEQGEYDLVSEHKIKYDETGAKLDSLLKVEARILLEKSKRGTEDKKTVSEYLVELDRTNIALVELETGAFAAMEKHDTETARKLIVSDQYENYKKELDVTYREWAVEEKRISDIYKNKNLANLKYILWANLVLGLLAIITGIILSRFIMHSIVNPLKKLDQVANEISSGNIDVKIPEESKKMQGIIGNIANSYDKLLESAQFALKTMVQKKIQHYEELYQSSNDALMTLAPPKWNFVLGNKATLKLFKVKDEKTFNALSPADLSPKYQPDGQLSSFKAKKMIEKAMREGSASFDWMHKRYKGENFSANVLLSRVGEGKDTYLQATVRETHGEKSKRKRG